MPAQLEVNGQSVGLREVDLNQLAQVADAQVDLADAAGMQPSQDVFEDRAVADGDKRLRQDRRVRAQPRTEPSCQDHGPHRGATGYIRA